MSESQLINEGRATVVFSGSFNPLHIGHLAILRTLCERAGVDRVLLVVSPKNPLKDSISADSAPARLRAAREALERYPELAGKVGISDIEFRLGAPHYTIRTLDALAGETDLDTGLRLAIGGDQLADFRRWKDYTRILLEYGLLVYPREGFDSAALRDDLLAENPSYRITLLDAPQVDISSTALRKGLLSRPEEFLM
ncbi:MAG: nicotinate (nicotinamide) nucleotide adenylyltransferase [Bacteroidales bacterium]|nr:nicotinate (nicotinamide) nucleotide adenylyltransferase [Bacteroidales bacterium]